MSKIKIMMIGSDTRFGLPLQEFFASYDRFDFQEQVPELNLALAKVGESKPDLVFVDASIEISQLVELVQQIRALNDTAKVCWLTVFDENVYKRFATEYGFDGAIPRVNFEQHINALLDEWFPPD